MTKTYNPNDLILLKEYKAFEENKKRFRSTFNKLRFSYEGTLSREEKIEWLNKYYEKNGQTGWYDYIIDLQKKFNLDKKSTIKLDCCNERVNTKSFIAWAKKNDTRKLVDDWYHYGKFQLFGTDSSLDLQVKYYSFKDNKMVFAEDKDFSEHLDEAFHNFLVQKVTEERKIYRETASISQKFEKLRGFIGTYGDLGLQLCCDIAFNIRVDELDHYDEKMFDEIIAEYEKLDAFAKTLKNSVEAIGQKYDYKRF